ncbi:MAG: low temperature requirement protein A [Solirubrobacterales bacterium]
MPGAATFRLEPPRLRTLEDTSEARHATWFELYFDLVFAAALAELAAGLAKDPSVSGFAKFAGLFVAVEWAWAGFTFYANRFDTDDLIYRLAKSGAALVIAAIAIQIPHVMEGSGGTAAFAVGYAVVRFLLVGLYFRARLHVFGEGRRLIDFLLVTFSFTASMWVVSAFVPGPYRFVLWGLALAIDYGSLPFAWATLEGPRVVVSHITERFGTFFIVVLGGSVVAVVAAVAGLEFSVEAWVIAGACFVIALCLWWIYFDLADTSVVGRGMLGLIYLYGHIPLFPGIGAFGAGTKLAILHAGDPALEAGARWALAGGIASFALALAILHLGAEWTSLRDRTFIGRIVLAVVLVALAAFGGAISPLAFVLLVAGAVLGQLLLEAFTFPTGAASVLEPADLAADSAG